MAALIHAAEWPAGRERRPVYHDHFDLVNVDLPGWIQLFFGAIPWLGRVWRLGRDVHRLDLPVGRIHSPICTRQMDEQKLYLRLDGSGQW